jgi:hemerythrin-like domain-containing protein
MGLDIYFDKVKPGKGIDANNISMLEKYRDERFKENFSRKINKIMARIRTATSVTERTELIDSIRAYCEKCRIYDFYYKHITAALSNAELEDAVTKLKRGAYARSDVYFRKVNFVYAFFAPYLEDERCIVTKDLVEELVENCKQVIAAGQKAKVLNENEEINPLLYYQYKDDENWINITKERRDEEEARIAKLTETLSTEWVELAEELLPTQAGFFFGSTDYTPYYLADVVDVKNQFTKLLADWKEGEVVYNVMSW